VKATTERRRSPRRLKPWELARVVKTFEDEIYKRTTGPFTRDDCCGDPHDIVAMEAALKILYWHTEKP